MSDGGVPLRLDHCVIASSDLARSDAFYAKVLGARIERSRDDFRQYRIGDQLLNIHGPGLAGSVSADLLAAIPVRPGNSDLCFEWVGDATALADHLAQCGVEITVGPVERTGARGAGISVYCRDPDGSLLEFIVYPPGQP